MRSEMDDGRWLCGSRRACPTDYELSTYRGFGCAPAAAEDLSSRAMTSGWGYAAATAARTTGFSTIGRLISAESTPNTTESHHTES
jgi:hypothetical protein